MTVTESGRCADSWRIITLAMVSFGRQPQNMPHLQAGVAWRPVRVCVDGARPSAVLPLARPASTGGLHDTGACKGRLALLE